MEDVLERFLRYVKIDTQSQEGGGSPALEKQLVLARLLAKELEDLGASQVRLDAEHAYVYARIPANLPAGKAAPAIGFIAHMDTSPAVSGENVKPRVLVYEGGDIDLSGDGTYVLRPGEFPVLNSYVGQELVVTDGGTLLGADDKAGVAEIMTMAEYLLTHPEAQHGEVRIAFTPNEEVGGGVAHFDLPAFGADFGYTVDGGALGGIEYENFNAASGEVTVTGRSTHPGSAKNAMRNAVLLAMEFQSMLPPAETPEHTEGYEGFYHLDSIGGDVEKCAMSYIIRDHDKAKFEARKSRFAAIGEYLNEKYGPGTFRTAVKDSYYNMKEIVLPRMEIVEKVKEAMLELGITPLVMPIRGGTDGAMLSCMGLPCPNLCTGGCNYHSRYEFASVPHMRQIVKLLVKIPEKHISR